MLTLAIPNYNGAKYIEETLRSLERNRPYVRWYLQDSSSRDASVEIARRHAGPDDRIQVEKDQGQADGINRAFAAMGGDIVGWLNADDCLADGAAKAVLDAFAQHPEADIVFGEVDWIDAEGQVTGHHAGGIQNLEQMLNVYDYWWKRKQWVQPEVFWRRSLWEKTGGLNTGLDLAFDYEFWVRCLLAGAKVVRLPGTLCQFRLHEAQKSKRATEAADEIRATVQNALDANAPVSGGLSRRLRRTIAYDRYQLGQNFAPDQRPSLARMLLKHPDWLLLRSVRRRLRGRLTA